MLFLSSRRVLAFGALVAGLLPLAATAQTFEWAQPRAINYISNPEMVRTAASVAPGGQHSWWAGLKQKRQFYNVAMGSLQLTRLRPDGTVALQQLVGGRASILQMQALADGGVVLLGEFIDSLVYDAQHTYANPNITRFVTQLDSAGAVRWHRVLRPGSIPSFSQVQSADALTLDSRGNLWVGYTAFSSSYAMRLNPATGDSLSTIVQLQVSALTSIAVAPDGTVYTAGGCAESNSTYNGTPAGLPTGITYNTYVACYAPNGAFQWVRHIEDITCPPTWVATADNSGVYFAGPLFGRWHFGPFQALTPGSTSTSTDSYFLTRLDRATGTFQWLREAPLAAFSGHTKPAAHQPLAVDGAGNAWLLTQTVGTTPWPGFTTSSAPVGGAAALLAYDVAGTLRAVQVGAGQSSSAHTLALDATTNHGIVAGLARAGGMLLAPLPALPGVTNPEMQLFAASFRATLAPLGTPAALHAAALALYPNPVAPGQAVQVRGASGEATLYNVLGQLVARHPLPKNATTEIAAPAAPGFYLVRTHDAAGRATTQRLVVE